MVRMFLLLHWFWWRYLCSDRARACGVGQGAGNGAGVAIAAGKEGCGSCFPPPGKKKARIIDSYRGGAGCC